MDLGSAQWANPTASFGQGVTQGAGLALSVNSALQAKKQQEWENDFRLGSTALTAANAIGLKTASGTKIMNESFKPFWDKYNPKNPFPEITPANVESVQPLVDTIYKTGQKMGKGDLPWETGMPMLGHEVASFWKKSEAEGKINEAQKTAVEAAMKPLEEGYKAAEEKAKEKAKAAEEFTPEKALARMSDLTRQDADLQKLDQQNALMMSLMGEKGGDVNKFKVDAAALATRRASVTNEMIQLNTHLPKEQQRIVIDSAQVDAIKNKLATRGVQGDKADEFIAANYLLKPSSTGPQQGPQVPPAAPQ